MYIQNGPYHYDGLFTYVSQLTLKYCDVKFRLPLLILDINSHWSKS